MTALTGTVPIFVTLPSLFLVITMPRAGGCSMHCRHVDTSSSQDSGAAPECRDPRGNNTMVTERDQNGG